MTKFTVKLAYTRHMEFEVDAETAHQAVAEVRSSFSYGDATPTEDYADGLELEGVQLDNRRIQIEHRYDFQAPKDERGLAPILTVARDYDTYRQLDQDFDEKALLDRVFAEPVTLTREQLAEVEHWSKTPFHDQPPAATS